MIRLLFFLLLATLLAPGQSRIPYEPSIGPLFSVKALDLSQSSHARSIRNVDFRNSWIFEPGPIRLKDGRYENEDRGTMSFDSVDLVSIHYVGSHYALVVYQELEGAGSSTNSAIAEIFRLSDGRLSVVQRVRWDEDAMRNETVPKPFSFNANTLVLVIRSSHYMPGDAHCCISAVDVVTFTWRDTHFEQIGIQTVLSSYGRAIGRKLE